MSEHFRDYLFYVPRFDVYTDYNPLTYIKSSCKVNASGQRWINELTDFNFTVHYKPSVENVVADTLSRLPINDVEDLQAFSGLCSVDEVKAIFDGAVFEGTTLNDAEKSKESKEVRSFLRDFEKLFISKDDGILY